MMSVIRIILSLLLFVILAQASAEEPMQVAMQPLAVISRNNSGTACTTEEYTTLGSTSGYATVARYEVANLYRAAKIASFSGNDGANICKAVITLTFVGGGDHTYWVAIYGNNTTPDPDEPDPGNVLGTSDSIVFHDDIATPTDTPFTFSVPTSGLSSSGIYWVVVYSTVENNSYYLNWHYTSATGGINNISTDNSDWSTTQTHILAFALYSSQ